MTRNLWIYGLLIALCGACSQEEEKLFNDTASIYFNLSGAQLDSIVYSFAKTTDTVHIVEIPVEIAGYASPVERYYKVEVDETRTTAKAGVHYKALSSVYTLPAGEFTAKMPVEVYSRDRLLDSVAVDLYLKIIPSGDFANETADRQEARLQISNILQKPSLWDPIYGRKYFGPWSKVKYKLILQVCNIDELPSWGSSNRYKLMGLGLTMQNYFRENYPVYDENNQIIEPTWTISF